MSDSTALQERAPLWRRAMARIRSLGWGPGSIAAILGVLILIGLLEPFLPSAEAKTIGTGMRRQAPSAEFWFGTDNLGRSILARVLEGIRITFLVSTVAVLAAAAVGAIIGMIAAWYRGWVDLIIARLADMIFAFPAVIFGVIIATIIGPGTLSAIVAVFFIVLPTMIRVVRSAAMTVVTRDFVTAARISGASSFRILFVHVLPNVASVSIVQTAYLLSIAMILESGLSFLGLGVQPPIASLGSLIRENNAYLMIAPWTILAPGLVLSLIIFCVNFVGDYARTVIEPAKPRPLE